MPSLRAYRCQFRGQSGKSGPGLPDVDSLIPVFAEWVDDDDKIEGEFVVHTHDRGIIPDPTARSFRQLVFKVDSEDDADEINVIIEDIDKHIVKLHCDSENDSEGKLWYLQPYFKEDGTVDVKESIDSSISTAGVYSLILRSGDCEKRYRIKVLPSLFTEQQYLSMVDSLISVHDRLISNNSRNKFVGIGVEKEDPSSGLPDFNIRWWESIKPHILAVMQLPAATQVKEYGTCAPHKLRSFDSRVIRDYAARRGSNRTTSIRFADSYDIYENRIIKALLRRSRDLVFRKSAVSGLDIDMMVGKDIAEEYPTENAKKLRSHLETELPKSNITDLGVETKLLAGRFPRIGQPSKNGNRRKMTIFLEEKNGVYSVSTNCQAFEGKGYEFFPFSGVGESSETNAPSGALFTTRDPRIVIDILKSLAGLYNDLSSKRQLSSFIVRAIKRTYRKDRVVDECYQNQYSRYKYPMPQQFVFSCVTQCGYGGILSNTSIKTYGDFYSEVLRALDSFPGETIKINLLRNFDVYSFVNQRSDYYSILNETREAYREARLTIGSILANSWFSEIEDVPLSTVEATPRFLHDPHYKVIFRLLQEALQTHPMLASNLDSSAVKVRPLHEVYEYWVLYKILEHLVNVGFHVAESNSNQVATLHESLRSFVESNEKPEGFTLVLNREIPLRGKEGPSSDDAGDFATIEVMVGFNCYFGYPKDNPKERGETSEEHNPANKKDPRKGSKEDPRKGSKTPDYFLRVYNPADENRYHWYFIDAKCDEYREYRATDQGERDYKGHEKETMKDVCRGKYTCKIQEPPPLPNAEMSCLEYFIERHSKEHADEWRGNVENKVMGSYLVVAEIEDPRPNADDDRPRPIADDDRTRLIADVDRLFGFDGGTQREHPYGLVKLAPSDDDNTVADAELTSLIQLIFDYKEGSCLLEYPNDLPQNSGSKEPDYFECADCEAHRIHVDGELEVLPIALRACWNSSVEHRSMQLPQMVLDRTQSKKYKVRVLCPECNSIKTVNYCQEPACRREIIKYDVGNYHKRAGSHGSDKWNFICPHCESKISRADDDRLSRE